MSSGTRCEQCPGWSICTLEFAGTGTIKDGTKAAAGSEFVERTGPLASSGLAAAVKLQDMRETSGEQTFDRLTLEFTLQVLSDASLVTSDTPDEEVKGTEADAEGIIKGSPFLGPSKTPEGRSSDGQVLESVMQEAGPRNGTKRPATICTFLLLTWV